MRIDSLGDVTMHSRQISSTYAVCTYIWSQRGWRVCRWGLAGSRELRRWTWCRRVESAWLTLGVDTAAGRPGWTHSGGTPGCSYTDTDRQRYRHRHIQRDTAAGRPGWTHSGETPGCSYTDTDTQRYRHRHIQGDIEADRPGWMHSGGTPGYSYTDTHTQTYRHRHIQGDTTQNINYRRIFICTFPLYLLICLCTTSVKDVILCKFL